jgi:hypothetical protein
MEYRHQIDGTAEWDLLNYGSFNAKYPFANFENIRPSPDYLLVENLDFWHSIIFMGEPPGKATKCLKILLDDLFPEGKHLCPKSNSDQDIARYIANVIFKGTKRPLSEKYVFNALSRLKARYEIRTVTDFPFETFGTDTMKLEIDEEVRQIVEQYERNGGEEATLEFIHMIRKEREKFRGIE